MKPHFGISVISDEITQDSGKACEIASKEFRMDWIELRLSDSNAKELPASPPRKWKYWMRRDCEREVS